MKTHPAIAYRLKHFGQSKFGAERGWKKRFADELGITPQHLNRYLSGASEPGNKMYMRLLELGCNIQWLLTGERTADVPERTRQENELLVELRKAGISTPQQLRPLLHPELLAEDIASTVAREIRARYIPRKQRKR
jgi:transcriptional regulator with XRE-family HTH domain